jgi:hypothetical protein
MKCALIATVIGAHYERSGLFVDGVCSGAALAARPGVVSALGAACATASDLLGLPDKVLGKISGLACAAAPALGTAFGTYLESHHEYDVAKDVIRHDKCLEYRDYFTVASWHAVACHNAGANPAPIMVPLSAIAPGKAGVLDSHSYPFPYSGPGSPFAYAVSTLHIGGADCNCVPPLAPDYLTLASMPATTCHSISLTILAPWATTDPGGSDEVSIVQAGMPTTTVTVTSAATRATLAAPLSGGPWQLRTSEITPATTGDQATVYVNGTLSCSTRSGR